MGEGAPAIAVATNHSPGTNGPISTDDRSQRKRRHAREPLPPLDLIGYHQAGDHCAFESSRETGEAVSRGVPGSWSSPRVEGWRDARRHFEASPGAIPVPFPAAKRK